MPTLAELRAQVAQANVAIERAGLVTLAFGNVSGVDRDAGVLVIKPSGVPYSGLTGDDMVVVSLEDGRPVAGSLRPSTDTPTHRLLYRELPGIGGIVHTHSPCATAWAQAGRPIPCLGTTHADYFRGDVPVTRQMRPAEIAGDYEWETGRLLVEALRADGRTPEDSPAVLVASHGPFAWGRSPAAAVEAAIALEAIALLALRTLQVEAATTGIGAELLARHFDRKHGQTAYYGQPAAADRPEPADRPDRPVADRRS
jgi:L-ribulose-5-phosphate 4-epimerase